MVFKLKFGTNNKVKVLKNGKPISVTKAYEVYKKNPNITFGFENIEDFPDDMLGEIMSNLNVTSIENAGKTCKTISKKYIPAAKKIRQEADKELYNAIRSLPTKKSLAVKLVKKALDKGANPNKIVKAFGKGRKFSPILYEVLWDKFRPYDGQINTILENSSSSGSSRDERRISRLNDHLERLRYAESNLIPEAVDTLRDFHPPGILQIEDLYEDGRIADILLPNGMTEEEWILSENEDLDKSRNKIIELLLKSGADPLKNHRYTDNIPDNAFTIAIKMGDCNAFLSLTNWQRKNRVSDKHWMDSLNLSEHTHCTPSGFPLYLHDIVSDDNANGYKYVNIGDPYPTYTHRELNNILTYINRQMDFETYA